MRLPRRALLGFLALTSSCDASLDGPRDTIRVAPGTPAPEVEEAKSADVSSGEAAPTVLGFAGSRFAVFEGAGSLLVFDADKNEAFKVEGLSPGGLTASADGTRMMVRSETGYRLVDLANRSAVVAEGNGDASRTEIAPDGLAFVAIANSVITIASAEGGGSATFALHGDSTPVFGWTPRFVHWSDDAGVHVVDRATWIEQRAPGAKVTMIDDQNGFAASRDGSASGPGFVAYWQFGETRPRWQVASAFVQNVIAGDGRVAWSDTSLEYGAKTSLHALELATGIHVRFSAKGAPCEIATESLLSIERGELITNDECTPGCPTLWMNPSFVGYDIATGTVRRRWKDTPVPPEDYEQTAQRDRSFGIDGPSLESSDGRLVAAAAANGRPAVWETQSGRRLWSWQ